VLEKIIMADLPAAYAIRKEHLEFHIRKARLVYLIELCERQLRIGRRENRTKYELMRYSYLTQLGLMEIPV